MKNLVKITFVFISLLIFSSFAMPEAGGCDYCLKDQLKVTGTWERYDSGKCFFFGEECGDVKLCRSGTENSCIEEYCRTWATGCGTKPPEE